MEKTLKREKADGFSKCFIGKVEETDGARIIYSDEEEKFELINRQKCEIKDESDDKKCVNIEVHEENIKPENSESQMIKSNKKTKSDSPKYIDPKQIVSDGGSSTLNRPVSEEPLVQIEESKYNCAHSAFSSTFRYRLIEHLPTHSSERLFVCAQCSYRAKRKTTLRKHILNVHLSKHLTTSGMRNCDKPYRCVSCDASYKHQYTLIKHVKRHNEDNKEAGKRCDICDFSSPNPFVLSNHVLTHSTKKYKCDHCEGVFSRSDVLKRHTVQFHTSRGLFRCESCRRKYTTRAGLEKHQSETCAGFNKTTMDCLSPRFKCTFCKKAFAYKSRLTVHMTKHTGQYRFKCSICTKGFSTYTLLRYHIYSHSKETRFQCTLCNFTTDYENTMTTHKANHHSNSNYECVDCNFVTKKGDVWLKHQAKHEFVKKFQCAHCDYKTNIRSRLLIHLRRHLVQ